jgi:hypothetical protein
MLSLDLVKHIARQITFSRTNFGPARGHVNGDIRIPSAHLATLGVIDHLKKELVEVERCPGDLSEWIDVIILAIDGAWRAGFSAEEITMGLLTKQIKNERRRWPDWRTATPGKAIEHIKEDTCHDPEGA